MKYLLLILLFVSCTSQEKLISIEGNTMGTYYRVKAYTKKDADELKQDVDKFLILFNNIFSTYLPDSEISKINRSKDLKAKVSQSFQRMLILSQEIYKKSEGHFDITVSPIVNLWGFGPDGKKRIAPSDEQIKLALKNIGSDHYQIKDKILRMDKKLTFDMSAIAKGFGVDELIKFLQYDGITNLLVEIGGEVRTSGHKDPEQKTPWRVGIEGPEENLGTKILKIINLKNRAMATSGSYRNYLKYGDKIFNHTINPKTGYPVEHKTVSVTVLEEYCADADAWATALMSMGVEKASQIAKRYDLSILIQYKENDQIKTYTSPAFDKEMEN